MLQATRTLLQSWRTTTVATADLEVALAAALGPVAYDAAGGYPAFASAVNALAKAGELIPVRSAPGNGRFPSLPARYRRPAAPLVVATDLLDRLHPDLATGWYRQHPAALAVDAAALSALDRFLRRRPAPAEIAINERSLEVFGDEKYLRSQDGETLLRRVGLPLDRLAVFVPPSPLVFEKYRCDRIERVLIIENMDTFHSLRVAYQRGAEPGGPRPDLLIWGEGNKITGALAQLDLVAGMAAEPVVAYFGDLDSEGLQILDRLQAFFPERQVTPAVPFYRALLARGQRRPWLRPWADELPPVLDRFPADLVAAIQALAVAGEWLPQEGLTHQDFRAGQVS